MISKIFVATLLLCVAVYVSQAQSNVNNWAVLVAGSNGYFNYRHQSDVCHAFQILKKNGIPSSNIIVMMYDDIANSPSNPHPGTIINIPGGPNVYTADLPKDYTGKDVTAANFLKILKGEDMTGVGSGKTLKSGPNDNVFIYWTDHGGPGILAFPSGPYLYAKDLIDTLEYMHTNNMYKQMVFYLEACESGSMFNNLLPTSWNIYVTTAANPYESSYACFYDNDYRAYLNDCYSIYWMNNTDHSDINKKTLQTQFEEVKAQTTQSHVCQYGDISWTNEVIGLFQGAQKEKVAPLTGVKTPQLKSGDVVSSRDVKKVWLQKQVESAVTDIEKLTWQKELALHMAQQQRSDVIWSSFAHQMNLHGVESKIMSFSNDDDRCHSKLALDVDCMKGAVEAAVSACGYFDETSFRYTKLLRDACFTGYSPKDIGAKLEQICSVVNNRF